MWVSSVVAPSAIKTRFPCEHYASSRMAPNVEDEETVCVAGACAIRRRVEAVTMATSVSATTNTVRSSRINYVEVKFPSF